MKKYLLILAVVFGTLFIGFKAYEFRNNLNELYTRVKSIVAHRLAGGFEHFDTDNQVSVLVLLNPITKPDVFLRINTEHNLDVTNFTMLYNNNILEFPIHHTFEKDVNGKTLKQHFTLLTKEQLELFNTLAKDKITNLTIKLENKLIDDLAGGDEIRRGSSFVLRRSLVRNSY